MTPQHCAWQAWHNLTSTVVLHGRRGTYGTGWRAWTWLGARDAAAFCVAGVAQPHIYRRFAWQAWHNLTSTVVVRGRRGTYGTGQVKLVICMQRCGPSGMFLLSACFGMFDFGMFKCYRSCQALDHSKKVTIRATD